MSAANPISVNSPGFLKASVLALRPKTLSAAVVPVMVATALVKACGHPVAPWISVVAVLSACMIQIGTNFVNDALDFKKGADGPGRLGEARATQKGWLTLRQVLGLAFLFFAFAFILGVPLVAEGGWPIVWIGLVSLTMGYAYTGGPCPLAYVGLGDLFVVVFFGLVAVGGVFYLQAKDYVVPAVVAGLQVGLLATVLIAVNNLRDLDQDRLVHKKTLAVRLGPRMARVEVGVLVAAAFALNVFWLLMGWYWAAALPMLALPAAIRVVRSVFTTPAGPIFNRFLAQSAFVHMLFGVLLSIGLLLG